MLQVALVFFRAQYQTLPARYSLDFQRLIPLRMPPLQDLYGTSIHSLFAHSPFAAADFDADVVLREMIFWEEDLRTCIFWGSGRGMQGKLELAISQVETEGGYVAVCHHRRGPDVGFRGSKIG